MLPLPFAVLPVSPSPLRVRITHSVENYGVEPTFASGIGENVAVNPLNEVEWQAARLTWARLAELFPVFEKLRAPLPKNGRKPSRSLAFGLEDSASPQ